MAEAMHNAGIYSVNMVIDEGPKQRHKLQVRVSTLGRYPGEEGLWFLLCEEGKS